MNTGYVCHVDSDSTNEGLGSHARGTVFPLLHISLTTGLSPVMKKLPPNLARDYSSLNLAAFWGMPQDVKNEDECRVIEVNTWMDSVLGSACGDAIELAKLIQEYLQQHATDKPIMVRLMGTLRYMNPTRPVQRWLQNHAHQWTRPYCGDDQLCIAAHVRVPEDFLPQRFKDDNHIDKLIQTLNIIVPCCNENPIIHVYTEETLTEEDERRLKRFADCTIVRGNTRTLLDDIMGMATADIFIPSSSHLSALVGYLTSGLIVLSDSSRLDYFQPHIELGCRVVEHPEQVSRSMRSYIRKRR